MAVWAAVSPRPSGPEPEMLMPRPRSSRPNAGLDEHALRATASLDLVLPLVPIAHIIVGDSEAGSTFRPTTGAVSPSDPTDAALANSLSSLGGAVLVVRLAPRQGNGVDVVIELLTGTQNQRLDGLLEPDPRHPSDGDRHELGSHPERDELVDYTPTSGHDIRTTLRQPQHDRSHTDKPRRARRRGRTAAMLASVVVLIGLILLTSPSRPDIPASSMTATRPPVTPTPWAYEAQWFAAVGPNSVPNLCAAGPSATLDWLAVPGALESCVQNQ
jgi:hypothetical protein